VKKSVVTTNALSSSSFQIAASSGSPNPAIRSGYSSGLKYPLIGRRTCASASAFNFDAQPEHVASVVNLIFLFCAV